MTVPPGLEGNRRPSGGDGHGGGEGTELGFLWPCLLPPSTGRLSLGTRQRWLQCLLLVCLVATCRATASPKPGLEDPVARDSACSSFADRPSLAFLVRAAVDHVYEKWYLSLVESLASFARSIPLVVVLDAEGSAPLHAQLLAQRYPYPSVLLEAMPGDGGAWLRTKGNHRMQSLGYNRMQFSNFFADLQTDAEVIGIIDTDVLVTAQVTPQDIWTSDGRIIVGLKVGSDRFCEPTAHAIGRPCPGDALGWWEPPIFFHRDTFRNFRAYVIRRLQVCVMVCRGL